MGTITQGMPKNNYQKGILYKLDFETAKVDLINKHTFFYTDDKREEIELNPIKGIDSIKREARITTVSSLKFEPEDRISLFGEKARRKILKVTPEVINKRDKLRRVGRTNQDENIKKVIILE